MRFCLFYHDDGGLIDSEDSHVVAPEADHQPHYGAMCTFCALIKFVDDQECGIMLLEVWIETYNCKEL